MVDIKKVRDNRFMVKENCQDIEILEALDMIKYALREYENPKTTELIEELKEIIIKKRRGIRTIETLLEMWQDDDAVELNETEYDMFTEYLILHDTGFRLVEVQSEYEYYLVTR